MKNKIKRFINGIKDFCYRDDNKKAFFVTIVVFAALWAAYVYYIFWNLIYVPLFPPLPQIPYYIFAGGVVIIGFLNEGINFTNIDKASFTLIERSTFAYFLVWGIRFFVAAHLGLPLPKTPLWPL